MFTFWTMFRKAVLKVLPLSTASTLLQWKKRAKNRQGPKQTKGKEKKGEKKRTDEAVICMLHQSGRPCCCVNHIFGLEHD